MSDIVITDWKPIASPVVKGAFHVTLASGMVLRNCTVCEKNGKAWVNGPSRQYEVGGMKKYEPLVDFVDRATRNRFSEAVLLALDEQCLGVRR